MAIYLKYASIKGDVTAEGFKDYIQLSSFQFGLGRGVASPLGSAADREASHPSLSEITVTKEYDVASSDLLKESLSGDGTAKANFAFTRTKSGGTGAEKYLEIKLEDVIISGYSMSSGGDRPAESISMNYVKIEFGNIPMKPDGTPDTSVKVSYDLAKMKMG
ncbi:MAG: hypothetical protein B7Z78_06690 [Rhodospirillales bacterium 20-60-12]|nr:MAG: hypothetical protein B7Z78_06690 [Rhodospirillales bacterium 20-60-12]HQT68022.1 type VI secretion system tube protein Hcp [Acetobacteraceae bacterium]